MNQNPIQEYFFSVYPPENYQTRVDLGIHDIDIKLDNMKQQANQAFNELSNRVETIATETQVLMQQSTSSNPYYDPNYDPYSRKQYEQAQGLIDYNRYRNPGPFGNQTPYDNQQQTLENQFKEELLRFRNKKSQIETLLDELFNPTEKMDYLFSMGYTGTVSPSNSFVDRDGITWEMDTAFYKEMKPKLKSFLLAKPTLKLKIS